MISTHLTERFELDPPIALTLMAAAGDATLRTRMSQC